MNPYGRRGRPAAERFWEKVDKSGSCWIWTAGRGDNGYGHFRGPDGRQGLAHRISYEMNVGPIPAGLVLDHLCRVRHCVNPSHLEPVTPGENVRRGQEAVKTYCKHGHPFDEQNTRVTAKGHRVCRACMARAAFHRLVRNERSRREYRP